MKNLIKKISPLKKTCIEIRKLYLERLARDSFNQTTNHNTYLKLIENISNTIAEKNF